MNRLLPLLFCFLFVSSATAQQFLRIERGGRAKTEKIPVGAEITYRLDGDRDWRTGYIEQLILEENIVVFGKQFVRLDQIDAIRFNRRLVRPFGYKLYQFAAAWTLYSGIATLVSDEYQPTTFDYGVVGGSLVSGFILERLLRYRTVRFGKRRRLRIVDLEVRKQKP